MKNEVLLPLVSQREQAYIATLSVSPFDGSEHNFSGNISIETKELILKEIYRIQELVKDYISFIPERERTKKFSVSITRNLASQRDDTLIETITGKSFDLALCLGIVSTITKCSLRRGLCASGQISDQNNIETVAYLQEKLFGNDGAVSNDAVNVILIPGEPSGYLASLRDGQTRQTLKKSYQCVQSMIKASPDKKETIIIRNLDDLFKKHFQQIFDTSELDKHVKQQYAQLIEDDLQDVLTLFFDKDHTIDDIVYPLKVTRNDEENKGIDKLLQSKENVIVLLGHAGFGKTISLLKYIRLLTDEYNSTRTSHIPVYVKLSSFSQELDPLELIKKHMQCDIDETYLKTLINSGRNVFIFDGINEIHGNSLQEINALITVLLNYISENLVKNGNRVIISSRKYSISHQPFNKYRDKIWEIKSITNEDKLSFSQHFLRDVYKWTGDENKIKEFAKRLKEHPYDTITSPFILLILISLIKSDEFDTTWDSVFNIFDRFLTYIYRREDQKDNKVFSMLDKKINDILSRIAYIGRLGGRISLERKKAIAEILIAMELGDDIESAEKAKDILNGLKSSSILQESRVLIKGDRCINFFHESIQEYFATLKILGEWQDISVDGIVAWCRKCDLEDIGITSIIEQPFCWNPLMAALRSVWNKELIISLLEDEGMPNAIKGIIEDLFYEIADSGDNDKTKDIITILCYLITDSKFGEKNYDTLTRIATRIALNTKEPDILKEIKRFYNKGSRKLAKEYRMPFAHYIYALTKKDIDVGFDIIKNLPALNMVFGTLLVTFVIGDLQKEEYIKRMSDIFQSKLKGINKIPIIKSIVNFTVKNALLWFKKDKLYTSPDGIGDYPSFNVSVTKLRDHNSALYQSFERIRDSIEYDKNINLRDYKEDMIRIYNTEAYIINVVGVVFLPVYIVQGREDALELIEEIYSECSITGRFWLLMSLTLTLDYSLLGIDSAYLDKLRHEIEKITGRFISEEGTREFFLRKNKTSKNLQQIFDYALLPISFLDLKAKGQLSWIIELSKTYANEPEYIVRILEALPIVGYYYPDEVMDALYRLEGINLSDDNISNAMARCCALLPKVPQNQIENYLNYIKADKIMLERMSSYWEKGYFGLGRSAFNIGTLNFLIYTFANPESNPCKYFSGVLEDIIETTKLEEKKFFKPVTVRGTVVEDGKARKVKEENIYATVYLARKVITRLYEFLRKYNYNIYDMLYGNSDTES